MYRDTRSNPDIRIYPMLKSSTVRHVVGGEYPLHRLFPTFLIVARRTAPVGALPQELSSRRARATGFDKRACGRCRTAERLGP
jgi:hypothetical protein